MKENLLIWVSLMIVLSNIYLLGTSRLGAMIKAIAFQGVFLSVLPLLFPHIKLEHILILSLFSVIVKGYIIPNFLARLIRNVSVKRELNPYVGYFVSVFFGLIVSFLSLFAVRKLPFYVHVVSPVHAATAMASILIGAFLIASRRNVLAQIIGFLVFENAGFILGVSVAASQPMFIEIGILFDLVAGVVIMGTAMKFIHHHFHNINVSSLERLSR